MRTIIYYIGIIVFLMACSKENTPAALPNGSVSFTFAADKDTIEMPLSILKDSAIVVGLQAALSGSPSAADHWVNFAVDTTKITAYRVKYGTATLLPPTSWLFYKSMTRISAGAALSDSAQLNIGIQTKLTVHYICIACGYSICRR